MKKDRKLIIAGNWKMNKTVAEALDLVRDLKLDLANIKEVDIVVCPPFTALGEVSKEILSSNIRLGRAEHERAQFRRFHRRNRGGDAQGIFGALRDPWPFGAAAVPEGIRRVDRQKSAGGARGGHQTHCLRGRSCSPSAKAARWRKFWKPRCAAVSRV